MKYLNETTLPVHKRLKIINGLKNQQRIGWRKIKKFHNSYKFNSAERYFYINQVINTMRLRDERIKRLQQSLNNN